MKHFLFCCSLLLLAVGLNARPVSSAETKKADSLLAIVSAELAKVNPEGALKPATEALSLSRRTGYSKGIAISSFHIGLMLTYLGDYQKSMKYLSLSEQEKYSKNTPLMLAEISRIKGQIYYQLGLGKASLNEFHKAYAYAVKIKDKEERDRFTSLAYENLGIAYNIVKDIPDSSLYYIRKNKKLLATTDENKTFKNKINLYTHYGEFYTERQQYDSAEYYFNKAQLLILKYDYPYSSWLYARWGDLHAQQGDNDSALVYYRKGLENVKRTNLKGELSEIYKRMSDIYSKQEEEDSAKLYREKYLQLNAELGNSKNEAAEEAVALLLKEEQKQSYRKIRRFASLTVLLLVIVVSASVIGHRCRSIKNRKKMQKKEYEVSVLKQKLNSASEELLKLAKKNDPAFLFRFRDIYPGLIRNILEKHPDITDSELWLSALIFLNLSSKEIAECMFITHRSVQTKKNRLRKKLDISGDTDLHRYFQALSLEK